MPPVITCKLTRDVGPAIKAHIVPRSFYFFDDDPQEPIRLLRGGDSPSVERRPIGEYDMNLVTLKGEDYFRDWDSYAADLFVNDVVPLWCLSKCHLFQEFRSIDYTTTKLFFMSVLWRAAASEREFYSAVKLGSHEERLRQHILRRDPGGVEDFSVLIARPLRTPAHGNPMYGPQVLAVKNDSCSFTLVKLYMSRFDVYFKLEPEPCWPLLTDLALAPGDRMKIAALDPADEGPEHDHMVQTVGDLVRLGRLR